MPWGFEESGSLTEVTDMLYTPYLVISELFQLSAAIQQRYEDRTASETKISYFCNYVEKLMKVINSKSNIFLVRLKT